jgi:hypothetical protein
MTSPYQIIEKNIENILKNKYIDYPHDLAKITALITLYLSKLEGQDRIENAESFQWYFTYGIVWTEWIEDYDQEIYDRFKHEDLEKILKALKDENFVNGILSALKN